MIITTLQKNRAALDHRHIRASLAKIRRVSLLAFALLGAVIPRAQATLPAGYQSNILYKKGYLDVSLYLTSPANIEANAGGTTLRLNEAIADGYKYNLVVYFPSGTYYINDTLKAHTITGSFDNMPSGDFQTPRDHHSAIVGSTKGSRPVIKLAANSLGFDNQTIPPSKSYPEEVPDGPKPLLEFRNWAIDKDSSTTSSEATPEWAVTPDNDPPRRIEKPDESYNQMLRGITLDCNATADRNKGAVGLHFYGAQGCSIENVKIIATNAHTGLRGLPSAGAGVVNLEIVGGRFGIDTDRNGAMRTGTASTVIAGLKLSGQTEQTIRSMGFAPLTIVGFAISPAAGMPGLKLAAASNPSNSTICLIDGTITVSATGSSTPPPAIDNDSRRNFYARNVYVFGTDQLVWRNAKDGLPLTRIGTMANPWKQIKEYNYCDLNPDNAYPASKLEDGAIISLPRLSTTLIEGTPGTAETNVISLAAAAPTDLINRHVWNALPSVDDPDAVDVMSDSRLLTSERILPTDTGVVLSAKLQAILDAHRKVFLPKGTYKLGAPLTLGAHNVLFGADRNLTRIEVDSAWTPWKDTSNNFIETPMIRTVVDQHGTTYLGDLSIGVDVGEVQPAQGDNQASPDDWFVALHWRVGRNSLVHIGPIYRSATDIEISKRNVTNPHSLVKITDAGGGRWYFLTAIKTYTSEHNDFRILKVMGTSQPLAFYALNPEHPRVADTYLEFNGASNVRIYSIKSEFDNDRSTLKMDPPPATTSSILWVKNCTNFAVYGHGAIRNSPSGQGVVEFTNSDDVLAALIVPQLYRLPEIHGDTLREIRTGSPTNRIAYPDTVNLFKRGEIDDNFMTNERPFYGAELILESIATEDGTLLQDGVVQSFSGGQALTIGDDKLNKQYRSILSFDTSANPIQAGAKIVDATVELRQGDTSGAMSEFGRLRADIKTGIFGNSSALAPEDFNASATSIDAIPFFLLSSSNSAWSVGTLNPAGLDAINRNGKTQVRVYFTTATTHIGVPNTKGFWAGEANEPSRPVLRIRYTQP
ncbi:MAG: hypothetical protein JNK23_02480 [Opitutaceae bacterium]|nr:hypothetical protein [Opitutaceae bacterium]